MKYEVIVKFIDIISKNLYNVGDEYKEKVSEERIQELTTENNKRGTPLIKPIESTDEQVDLKGMSVTELRKLAKNKGVDGYTKLKKAELIEVLQ
ncbi:Rho termination factor N-terminal domain-containing protein [Mammaliicoccus sciuri]|uniref:Rho termination factor N-terminal domain-containing protein n=1 Tax=Mammaliicoccus sciuri TaxID=1296 RepID=UPI001627D778|nr:Rho termination factor N-terminal domain-containing protein [Mammaliicoccus sciuri]